MKKALQYINDELGINFQIKKGALDLKNSLPLYILSYYNILPALIQNVKVILLFPKHSEEIPTVAQIKKHVSTVEQLNNIPVNTTSFSQL